MPQKEHSTLFTSLSKDSFINNKKKINDANNTLLRVTSAMGTVIYTVMLLIVLIWPKARDNPSKYSYVYVSAYIGLLIICTSICLYTHLLSKKHPGFILPFFYFIFTGLYVYAIINRFYATPCGQAFTFEMVITLMPIILLDRTPRLLIIETLYLFAFVYLDITRGIELFGITWRDDFVNMITCYFIGNFGGLIIRSSRIQAIEYSRIVGVQRDTDELTALPNRRKLFHELRKSYDGRANPIKCLFIADIDFFKKYNDTFGHPAGDEVLQKIGVYFDKYDEETGFELFRYGGEEFVGIYRAPANIDYAAAAHRLCKEVRDLKIERALPDMPYITISVGYAIADKAHPTGYEDFISMADNALYEAKNHGRNCTIEYIPTATAPSVANNAPSTEDAVAEQ